ncbi:phage holin family protein [Nocardioides sp. GXQ0305]|uniref:phage holin family protein n=1 Tax=Nocardioides sp. GXQ0305 TaxID=3423912 RepID=UPI003D7D0CB9
MKLLIWMAINIVAVGVAAWLVPGIEFTDGDRLADYWPALIAVGAILGVVSAFVKPVVQLLSIPFIIVTLGLFLWIINAAMLELTAWLAGLFDLGFRVDDFFWSALLGALVISVVNWAVATIVD